MNFTFFDCFDDAVNGRCTQSNWHSNSFYLNPYGDVTQGPGKYFSETIYTQSAIGQVAQGTNIQRMNLEKL